VTLPHFSDHAANERTFLAWVRTAIAVMAFGFLVERFDLFLEVAGQSLNRRINLAGQVAGSVVGLILIIAGALMVAVAMFRFARNRTAIDADTPQKNSSGNLDIALATLIVLLGLALGFYLAHSLIFARPS